jgi:hypothetical protein
MKCSLYQNRGEPKLAAIVFLLSLFQYAEGASTHRGQTMPITSITQGKLTNTP